MYRGRGGYILGFIFGNGGFHNPYGKGWSVDGLWLYMGIVGRRLELG